jgi:hypothetical protein
MPGSLSRHSQKLRLAELLEQQKPKDCCFYGISTCQNGVVLKNGSFGLANCCGDVRPFISFNYNAVEGIEKAKVLGRAVKASYF